MTTWRERRGLVDDDTMWGFEPHVAEKIFREMLAEAGVKLVCGQRLDLNGGVRKQGPRISEITMESGQVYAGRMFIDATYEGDLMAKAGVELRRRPRGELPVRRNAQRRPDPPRHAAPVQPAGRSVRDSRRRQAAACCRAFTPAARARTAKATGGSRPTTIACA